MCRPRFISLESGRSRREHGNKIVHASVESLLTRWLVCNWMRVHTSSWRKSVLKIGFEINGCQVDGNDIGTLFEQAILKGIRNQIQSKLMGVRDPETGEFPTVVVRGRDWDHLSIEVTGSKKLVALCKERLGIGEDGSQTNGDNVTSGKILKSAACVFLCHASEDKSLARRIAEELLKQGVDTFFDQWEIGPGDSIRQKIDAGLADCTHFVVLLTPQSLSKAWVNAEIDAGFVRKLEGHCKFIPLRHDLPVDALPPLLKALYSPGLADYENDLRALISFIHGFSEKPPMGPEPEIVSKSSRGQLGLSVAAEALVRYMVEKSENGETMDPGLSPELVRELTKLADDDIIDAIDELESQGFVKALRSLNSGPLGFAALGPEAGLFAKFDKYSKDWDPEADALRIAADLVNELDGATVSALGARYGWPPRRTNPAVIFLEERRLIESSAAIGNHPWVRYSIRKNPATRRFVRDRS
jgi:hypothetical protein